MRTIRFCEFTGDSVHHFDEAGYKEACPFLGFRHCTLHDKPLTISEDGWRVCCEERTVPVQVILLQRRNRMNTFDTNPRSMQCT